MTHTNPRNVRDAMILARKILGKPTYSWSYDVPLTDPEGTSMLIPESFTVVTMGTTDNVVLKCRFRYSGNGHWDESPGTWYMLDWSFQTKEDYERMQGNR